jgi:hypothetical protein
MAMTQSRLAYLLSISPTFQGRVQLILFNVASSVLVETTGGTAHAARAAFAKAILLNPTQVAAVAAPFVAQGTVVLAATTMEDEGPRTTVTDAQLITQITADWSKMAGVDSGS